MPLGSKKHERSDFGTARQNAVILGRSPAQRTTAVSAAYSLASLYAEPRDREKFAQTALDFDLLTDVIRNGGHKRSQE